MELEKNQFQEQIVHVHCIQCQSKTRHLVMQGVATQGSKILETYMNGNFQIEQNGINWSDDYQIIQCQGCETISFRHLHWFSEHYNPEDQMDGNTERLYPQRSNNTQATADFPKVPEELRRIYGETIDAFNYKCFTLCAGGLRALVEGICASQGVKDGPVNITKPDGPAEKRRSDKLEGKIAGLCENFILTETQAEQLHEHRCMGNDALHALKQPSTDELLLGIEIIEHTLRSLYEIPHKGNLLRASKKKQIEKVGTP